MTDHKVEYLTEVSGVEVEEELYSEYSVTMAREKEYGEAGRCPSLFKYGIIVGEKPAW